MNGTPDPLSEANLQKLLPDDLRRNEPGQKSLRVLRDLQRQHDAVFDEYFLEKQRLEERYERRFSPLFAARRLELEKRLVDKFWLRAFENCEMLRENITEKDQVALGYLTDVTCKSVQTAGEGSDMPVGSFVLTFTFAENPFFTNSVLTKTYVMSPNSYEDLAEARGCEVHWKTGKNLSVRFMRKKGKNGQVLIKKKPTDSFFNFFSPPKGLEGLDAGEADPAVLEELEDVMDADYELGECIRTDIIPRALVFFLNLAEMSEDEDDDEDDDDEDSEDEDDDDDDTDDDDDRPQSLSSAKPSLPPAATTPEECKQQ